MKTLSLATLLLFNVAFLAAQDVKVEAVKRNMSQGEQPGFTILLPKADVKTVEIGLAELLQGKSRTKPVKANNEWVMLHTILPKITQDTVDIYARTIATTEGVVVDFFFKDSVGFVSSDRPSIFAQSEKFVYDFAKSQRKVTIKNQIDAAEDVLKSFEKDYSSLSKDLEKLSQGITKSKLEIDENTNKIATNESDQERVREQIQEQKKKVNEAAKLSPEAKKAEEKNLKTLEKELSSIIKDKEKLYKANVKCDTDVRNAEQEIKNKEVELENKQKQIAEQKGKIKVLEDELLSYN